MLSALVLLVSAILSLLLWFSAGAAASLTSDIVGTDLEVYWPVFIGLVAVLMVGIYLWYRVDSRVMKELERADAVLRQLKILEGELVTVNKAILDIGSDVNTTSNGLTALQREQERVESNYE